METMLEYKNYHAKITFSAEDMVFIGEVFGLSDSLNFAGETVSELTEMFHNSVDNYLAICAEVGKEPEKEFKGSFNVRIAPELHRAATQKAIESDLSLNALVEQALREKVEGRESASQTVYILEQAPQTIPFLKSAYGHFEKAKEIPVPKGVLNYARS